MRDYAEVDDNNQGGDLRNHFRDGAKRRICSALCPKYCQANRLFYPTYLLVL